MSWPLIAIVGQTASGKTSLALELAERWNGEIIAADSRTVYRGMDIGTAKPTAAECKRIPHYLIDIYNPDQQCTARDFQNLANDAIKAISARGKIPFLVGGSGLYVDAVLFGFNFRGEPDMAQRRQLEVLSVPELQSKLADRGIQLPANPANPRHLVRAIETNGAVPERSAMRPAAIVLGVNIDKSVLDERIEQRVDAMFAAGLEVEVQRLRLRYGWECPPMQTIGYQEFRPYFEGQTQIKDVRQAIITHSRQYAKRQKTWFKRNKSIHWISNTEEAVAVLTTKMNK